jgi:hypothetical protein
LVPPQIGFEMNISAKYRHNENIMSSDMAKAYIMQVPYEIRPQNMDDMIDKDEWW